MEDALLSVFSQLERINGQEIEEANNAVRRILEQNSSDSLRALLSILGSTSSGHVAFCATGTLRNWKAIHWDALNEAEQMAVLGEMKPLLFMNSPVQRCVNDLFFEMANSISKKPVWVSLVSDVTRLPSDKSEAGLTVLRTAAKFFNEFPVEWETVRVFTSVTIRFCALEMLESPEKMAMLRLAIRARLPLLIMYVVKGNAVDPELHAQEAWSQFVEFFTFLRQVLEFNCEHMELAFIKVCSTISKFTNEVLATLQVTNHQLFESIRGQLLPVLWSRTIGLFQEIDNTKKKYLTNLLTPVAFFSKGLNMDCVCFNWVVLLSAISSDDAADFCYNPGVYYRFAYSLEDACLRSCALNLAVTMTQGMGSGQLEQLVRIIPPVEQGAILFAHISKAFVCGGDSTRKALYMWTKMYMSSKKRPIEIATALFFLSKALPCISNPRDIEMATKMGFDFITSKWPVIACNAAKLLKRLTHVGLVIPPSIIPVLTRLTLVAVTHHPLVLLNQCLETEPAVYAQMSEVAECCIRSIYEEMADTRESKRKKKVIDADFDLLIGIVKHLGDVTPIFARSIIEVVELVIKSGSFDVWDKVWTLMDVSIERESVNSLHFLQMTMSILGQYSSAADCIPSIAEILLAFMSKDFSTFQQLRAGEQAFHHLVNLLSSGSISDESSIFIAAELLTSILKCDTSFDANPVLPVLPRLIESHTDIVQLAGFDLLASFLSSRTAEIPHAILLRWQQFLRDHSLPTQWRVAMHTAALAHLAPESNSTPPWSSELPVLPKLDLFMSSH